MSSNMRQSFKWTDDEIGLIEAVKKHHYFCSPNYKGTKEDLSRIWWNISNEVKVSALDCRQKWSKIKNRYLKIVLNKEKTPARTKYLDGRLSFLDQYFVQKTAVSSPSAIHDVVVIESDEDLGDTKDYMVLDLEMIDNLLLKRGPHEDIEMARMEEILSIVSKRIEETLALNPHLNQRNTPAEVIEPETSTSEVSHIPPTEMDIPEVIELDDGSDSDSVSQAPQGDDMDEETSDNLRSAIIAFPNPSQDKTANTSRNPVRSTSVHVHQKRAEKSEDMETVFDIHRRSDTKTFFQELGYYMNRFSKEKQEEIRLKICCVVTEVELEEMD